MSLLSSKKRVLIRTKIFIGVGLFVILNILVNIIIVRISINDIYLGLEKRELKKQYQLVSDTIGDENKLIEVLYKASDGGIKIKILDANLNVVDTIFNDKLNGQFTNLDVLLLNSLGNEKSVIVTLKNYNNSGYDMYLVGKVKQNYVILSSSIETLKKDAKTTTIIIVMTSVLTFFILILLAYFISKLFSKKVNEVKIVTDDISKLKFGRKLEISTNDEIGDLFDNINNMSDKLQESIKNLELANKQLRRDLEEKEKQEKSRRKLTANISHEFKTPLTIISGYAQLLMNSVKSKEDKENLGMIINESQRLSDLVYEFLDLSKLESGSMKLNMVNIDLNSLISGELKKLDVRIKDRNLNVETDFCDNALFLIDKKLMIRVIDNVLTNAIKFANQSGTIKISTFFSDNKELHLTVYNSGSSIKEEDLENIFNSYYKDKSTRNKEGTGLGLTIVNAIINLHNGDCKVKNVDDGVVFEITLNEKK